MKAIWLIAMNFLYEQRIALAVFIGWVLVLTVVVAALGQRASLTDLQSLMQQQILYGIGYCLIIALSAIPGERKSRKIVLVLAKGIYRAEYLAGLFMGQGLLAGIYFCYLGVLYSILLSARGVHISLFGLLVTAWITSLLSASIALFLSSFLHPAVAASGAGFIIASPLLLQLASGLRLDLSLPVVYVIRQILEFSLANGWQAGWSYAFVAGAETIAFWGLASWAFAKQDVTSVD